jgi:hypothetical protein
MSSAGERAPSTNSGKTTNWSASARIASAIAVLNFGPGETVIGSSTIGHVPCRYFSGLEACEGRYIAAPSFWMGEWNKIESRADGLNRLGRLQRHPAGHALDNKKPQGQRFAATFSAKNPTLALGEGPVP